MNDLSRCAGHTKQTPYGIAFRSDCLLCARRLAGQGQQPPIAPWMDAPKETPCPKYVEAKA